MFYNDYNESYTMSFLNYEKSCDSKVKTNLYYNSIECI